MPSEGQDMDTLSQSSASIANNDLFRRLIRESPLDDNDSVKTSTSSVKQLRNMFKGNTMQSEADLANQNVFQLYFDSGSELNTLGSDETVPNNNPFPLVTSRPQQSDDVASIHSSIIEQIAQLQHVPFGAPAQVAEAIQGYEDERFKYLHLYEEQVRLNKKKEANEILAQMKDGNEIPLQTMNSNRTSIFELSKLDDFNKYVKQTEINDIIQAQLASKKRGNQDNILNVVDDNQFFQNFYADHEERGGSVNTKRSKNLIHKPSWYSKKISKDDNTTLPASASKAPKPSFSKWMTTKLDNTQKTTGSTSKQLDDTFLTNVSSVESPIPGQPNYLQRKLRVRHLQMISFGGTLGVGLFLNSGKALTIAGGFGTLLSFTICGLIVLTTIMSFCEMVTFISVVDGVSGLSSRFVDDAFGFAVGWLYWASFAFGLAGEVVASVIMLAYYPNLSITTNHALSVGFVFLFLLIIILVNLIDVRIFGEIEYISSLVKLVLVFLMIVFMIVVNVGGFHGRDSYIGFRYWDYSKSNFDHNMIFGLFRPSFNLQDNGTSPPSDGTGGDLGRFLSLLTAMMVVSYAYSGTEIVCIAACEAQNPRKALPSATKRVFWRIIIFYCLSAFVVSLNVYAGDPRLLRYYSGSTGVDQTDFSGNFAIQYAGGANCRSDALVFAGYGTGAQSPWIVALQSIGLCKLSGVVNGFLVFIAVSCGNAQLYVSSRTLYSLALQKKAPNFLTYCNRAGIPYNSVLFSASFGLFAFICVSESATVVFQNLTSLIASSGVLVWFAMCLSYIRFYYGLKRRPDIINRDDKSYPYKSPLQPYSAMFGLFGSTVIILGMGFVVFLKNEWDVMFFFSSYGTLMVFAVLYLGYKIVRGTRIPSLDTLDFDSGRTEMDRYIWDGGRDYNIRSIKDVIHKWISFLA